MGKTGHVMCLGIAALFLIIIVTVIAISLIFTVFKIRNPEISIHPKGLDKLTPPTNSSANVTLAAEVTVVNRNYGSFKYENSTAYVYFDGNVVAQIPLEANVVPARSTINVATTAEFMAAKLTSDHKFWHEAFQGTVNFTSSALTPGKVWLIRLIKLRATVYTTCDLQFHVLHMDIDSKCVSKIKL